MDLFLVCLYTSLQCLLPVRDIDQTLGKVKTNCMFPKYQYFKASLQDKENRAYLTTTVNVKLKELVEENFRQIILVMFQN